MHDLVDLVSRNPGFDMRRGDVEHFSGNLAECVQRQLGRWMMIRRKSRTWHALRSFCCSSSFNIRGGCPEALFSALGIPGKHGSMYC